MYTSLINYSGRIKLGDESIPNRTWLAEVKLVNGTDLWWSLAYLEIQRGKGYTFIITLPEQFRCYLGGLGNMHFLVKYAGYGGYEIRDRYFSQVAWLSLEVREGSGKRVDRSDLQNIATIELDNIHSQNY